MRALHSKYKQSIGFSCCLISLSDKALLPADDLRSILFPTNTHKAFGTVLCTSSYHYIRKFLTGLIALVKVDFSTTEIVIRKMSELG